MRLYWEGVGGWGKQQDVYNGGQRECAMYCKSDNGESTTKKIRKK